MILLNEYVELLKEAGLDDWIIHKIKATSTELFVIDSQVDMPRIKSIMEYQVEVFMDSEVDGKKCRGHAFVKMGGTVSKEEFKQKVEEAKLAALKLHDEYYELPKRLVSLNMVESEDSQLERLKGIVDTLVSIETKENERINSFEVYVKNVGNHIVTSRGSDIRYRNKYNNMEVVVNVNDEQHEIEIVYEDSFDLKSEEELRQDILKVLERGNDRLKAQKNIYAPKNVIISGKNVLAFKDYFTYKVNAFAAYVKASNVGINDPIFKGEIKGDVVNMKVYRHLPGASNNAPCGGAGTPAKNATIIEDGICKNYVGNYRYAYYMNVPCIPTIHLELAGGKKSIAELKREPYLECVEFSDFQVEPDTGEFAGELRLGYYFDGEKIIPVTGGSISGDLGELGHEFYLSKETKQYDNDIFPLSVLLKGATIAVNEE